MAFKWNPPSAGSQPSLEESLEQIRQKFKGVKGFKGGGSFMSSLIVFLVLAIAGWTSWFTVQPEETGVVQRFGEVTRTADPGLHFKIPFMIETVR